MTFPRMGATMCVTDVTSAMLVTDVDSKVTNVVILPPTGPPEGTYFLINCQND